MRVKHQKVRIIYNKANYNQIITVFCRIELPKICHILIYMMLWIMLQLKKRECSKLLMLLKKENGKFDSKKKCDC